MLTTIDSARGKFILNALHIKERNEWVGYLVKDGTYYGSLPDPCSVRSNLVEAACKYLSNKFPDDQFSPSNPT